MDIFIAERLFDLRSNAITGEDAASRRKHIMTDAEIADLAVKLTAADFHKVLLRMIDIRMAQEPRVDRDELRALADACVAYEFVVYPNT